MEPTPRDDRDRRTLAYGLAAAALQSLLVLAIAGPRLTAGSEDTDLYHRYARMALQGRVPYRHFAVEYPPLALPLFLGPAAVTRDASGFKVAFAVEMLGLNALAVLLVARRVGRREGPGHVPMRMAWYTLCLLILARMAVTRYDAAPMLLAFAAATAWSSGHSGLGGMLAGLGALTKVSPAAIAAVGSARDLARPGAGRFRGAAAFLLTMILGASAWVALGGVRGVAASVDYQAGRGFEYGSLYSGAQMLAAKAVGAPIEIARDHASFSSITPWSAALLPWAVPIQAAALLAVCAAARRRRDDDMVRDSAAAVLALIATGKVFSPQYLLWPLPLLAALEGPIAPRARRLFAAICAATLLAPSLLNVVPRTGLAVVLAYNARNLLMVALLALLLLGRAGDRHRAGAGWPFHFGRRMA